MRSPGKPPELNMTGLRYTVPNVSFLFTFKDIFLAIHVALQLSEW